MQQSGHLASVPAFSDAKKKAKILKLLILGKGGCRDADGDGGGGGGGGRVHVRQTLGKMYPSSHHYLQG